MLGENHDMIQRALKEHIRLMYLSLNASDHHDLQIFSDVLKEHVRFEERELFQEVQKLATEEELKLIQEHHKEEEFCERSEDEFWK